MSARYTDILATVIQKVRDTVNEDWIREYPIGPQTQISRDLEIESIEMVILASSIQRHYGARLSLVDWLSGRSLEDLISLSVGDLVRHIDQALPPDA
ncbi:MAG TPA: phosphopantetheine-binding protein [Solimonas sp.]